jgi:hypothetical protein
MQKIQKPQRENRDCAAAGAHCKPGFGAPMREGLMSIRELKRVAVGNDEKAALGAVDEIAIRTPRCWGAGGTRMPPTKNQT